MFSMRNQLTNEFILRINFCLGLALDFCIFAQRVLGICEGGF